MVNKNSSDSPSMNAKKWGLRIGMVQWSSNFTGAFLCTFYFNFLDSPEISLALAPALIVAFFLTACLMIVGSIISMKWQKEIGETWIVMEEGETIHPRRLHRSQRKVLNAPFFHSLITLSTWTFAALFMSGYQYFSESSLTSNVNALYGGLRIFFGIFISGGATACIVFFLTEKLFRQVRPIFFPDGGLTTMKGVFRLRIRTRLLFTYLLVSVVPVVVVFLLLLHKINTSFPELPPHIFNNLLYVFIFIPVILLAVNILLSRLVSESVADPVNRMTEAMHRVKQGDLTVTLAVNDNDELGSLANSFNDMIAGLRERDLIKDTFGRYLSEEIRDEVLAGRIPLDGELKNVTVMFADLRDFTPLTESNDPKVVVKIMNSYFKEMAEAVRTTSGLVLQYLGDEIYAVFGAPIDVPDHPLRAFQAAIEMNRRLTDLNRRLVSEKLPELRHGIGIHTGDVVAANIGSPDRLSYLLIGDTVNLASRLQGLTRKFSVDVILSGETVKGLPRNNFQGAETRELGQVTVKGKSYPVTIFTVA